MSSRSESGSPYPPLKETLTLPKTDFPMKANLPQNEPLRLKQWEESNLYQQIRGSRNGSSRYLLHDGPPYANGPIHLGHALNKCLKDFIVKSKPWQASTPPTSPASTATACPLRSK